MVPSAVCLFLSEFFVRSAKNIIKSLQIRKIVVPLHSRFENGMLGSIAQLVQSVCLTSRGSGVRLPLLPLKRMAEKLSFFSYQFLKTFYYIYKKLGST